MGYEVGRLKHHLVEALGIRETRNLVIVGAGNLGMALANYRGFLADGFRTVAMIDRDPRLVGGQSRSGVPVYHTSELERLLREEKVEIGILAIPAAEAQEVCDLLVRAGIRAILNFAPVRLRAPENVKVRDVDLRISLESLSFFLEHSNDSVMSC